MESYSRWSFVWDSYGIFDVRSSVLAVHSLLSLGNSPLYECATLETYLSLLMRPHILTATYSNLLVFPCATVGGIPSVI